VLTLNEGMETLGIWLRRTREARNLTPEQVEAATRIKPRLLEILEAGNFSALPGGDMQARGFLRIYARYLGLPADEVMARYEAEVHGLRYVPPARTPPAQSAGALPGSTTAHISPSPAPAPVPLEGPRRRWGTLETLLVGGLALAVLVAVLAGVSYLITRSASATDGSATVAATPTPDVTQAVAAEAAQVEPTATLPVLQSTGEGVTLTLEATEHVWVQVTTDDEVAFRGLLAPQQALTWSADQRIAVETGNGAGLQAIVNGQVIGALGERGQVTRRAWGPRGELPVAAGGP